MAEGKVDNIKRMIIRYIRDNRLKAGDRIPSQVQLRKLYGCGVTTITSAIGELEAEGTLAARDKVGVFVCNPYASGIYGRRIGIISGQLGNNSLICLFKTFIEMFLQEDDCQVLPFFQRSDADIKYHNDFCDIPRLKDTVDSGILDGLLATIVLAPEVVAYCRSRGVKVLHLLNFVEEPNYLDVDYASVIRESVHKMAAKGISVIHHITLSSTGFMSRIFMESVQKELGAEAAELCKSYSREYFSGNNIMSIVTTIVNEWYAMPEAERPEGVLILDDILAMHFLFVLQRHGNWKPVFVIMRNTGAGPGLPFVKSSIGSWELDIKKLAFFSAGIFMNMLRNDTDEIPFTSFKATFVE